MNYLKKWWAPFITIPFMSFFLLALMYLLIYPWLAMRGIGLVLALIMSGLSFKLYRANYFLLLFIWLLSVALPLLFQMTTYEGSYNYALAGHFLNYQLVAIFLTAILSAFKRKLGSVAV